MNGYIVGRAIIAATGEHVTIIDHPARVDLRLDARFSPRTLCQALRHSIGEFADLTGASQAVITESLAAHGLVSTSRPEDPCFPWAVPLAGALEDPERALRLGNVIYTAAEAFWPGSDPGLARLAFRMFVSRLTGIGRCAAYAPLAAGFGVCVAGDEPEGAMLQRAWQALAGNNEPCVADLRSGAVTGRVAAPADVWTESGGRLSITSCTHREDWAVGPDSTFTWATGYCAFSNLSALPALSDLAAYKTLDYPRASGVDRDPGAAVAKCRAEGLERFAAGDIHPGEIRRCAALELTGEWLDPRSIFAYSPAQRQRLGLRDFDAGHSDWWVRGENHSGPIWIPACLVFYPFTQIPPWLAPSAVSSNGMAAYMTLEGALQRAWLELVERDAFQRARFTGPSNPPAQVRPETLPKQPRDMVSHIAQQATVHVLILKSPTNIPVALVRAESGHGIALGAAAASDPAEAVTKAATETFMLVNRPFLHEVDEHAVRTPGDHAALYNRPEWRRKLAWMTQGPVIGLSDLGNSVPPRIGQRACWYTFLSGAPGLHVVRVLDPDLIPLTFGYDGDPAGRSDMRALLQTLGQCLDHPLEPHAFA